MIEMACVVGGVGAAAVAWLAWELRARRLQVRPSAAPKRARVPRLRRGGDGGDGGSRGR